MKGQFIHIRRRHLRAAGPGRRAAAAAADAGAAGSVCWIARHHDDDDVTMMMTCDPAIMTADAGAAGSVCWIARHHHRHDGVLRQLSHSCVTWCLLRWRATRADPGRVAQRPVATVLSLERPTADVLDAFLQRRSMAAYNHPFVGCTSLVNDIVSTLTGIASPAREHARSLCTCMCLCLHLCVRPRLQADRCL